MTYCKVSIHHMTYELNLITNKIFFSYLKEAINFLKSQESLKGLQWHVRMSVGEVRFDNFEKKSFEELGILTDTNLLVVCDV